MITFASLHYSFMCIFFWLIFFDGDTWRCISIVIFCVKFAFVKKDVFLCEKDEKDMYTIERGFLFKVQIEGLPDGDKKVCLRTDAMHDFRYYCSRQSVADNGDLVAEWDAGITEQMPLAVFHLEVYMEDRSKIWSCDRFAQTSNNVISLKNEQ